MVVFLRVCVCERGVCSCVCVYLRVVEGVFLCVNVCTCVPVFVRV